MKTLKSISTAIIALALFAQPALAAPVVQWTPNKVTRLVFPGQTLRLRFSFTSTQTITNASVVVVPALQPVVQVSPASFTAISPGITYVIDANITIPTSQLAGTTYNGTVRLVSGTQTLAQPISLFLDVETATFEDPDPWIPEAREN
jgi:hypothetical protein